jgi:hypothetical protein
MEACKVDPWGTALPAVLNARVGQEGSGNVDKLPKLASIED